MMQALITALIVAGSACYVLWRLLLPARARRRMLQALGRETPAASGCHCDGCEHAAAAVRPPSGQVVQWLPRRRG